MRAHETQPSSLYYYSLIVVLFSTRTTVTLCVAPPCKVCKKTFLQHKNSKENSDQYFVSSFVVLSQEHGVGGQFSTSRALVAHCACFGLPVALCISKGCSAFPRTKIRLMSGRFEFPKLGRPLVSQQTSCTDGTWPSHVPRGARRAHCRHVNML